MSITVEIPGRDPLELEFLLLDVNGTLSDRGSLIDGVEERLALLRERIEPRLLSADTFGSLDEIAARLRVEAGHARTADEKRAIVRNLGATRCAAIGNGQNDAELLAEAGLGIAVVGPEGASTAALIAADLVCRSILEALDLLMEPHALAATLRP